MFLKELKLENFRNLENLELNFDKNKMVRITEVKKDIPDIVEGEYVLYVSAIITSI